MAWAIIRACRGSHEGCPFRVSFTVAARLRAAAVVAALAAATLGAGRGWASVTLTNFAAKAQGNTIVVSWETGTEMDTAGFYVRRGLTPDAGAHVLASGFIPATGTSVAGDAYRWVDAKVGRDATYYYSLQERALNQTVSDYPQVVCARLDGARCDAALPSPTAPPPTQRPPPAPTGGSGANATPTAKGGAAATATAAAGTKVPATGPTAPAGGRGSATPRRATSAPGAAAATSAAPAGTTSLLRPVSTAVGNAPQSRRTATLARGASNQGTRVAIPSAGATPAGSVASGSIAVSTALPAADDLGAATGSDAAAGATAVPGDSAAVEPGSDAVAPGVALPAGTGGAAGATPDGRSGGDRTRSPAPRDSEPLIIAVLVLVFAAVAWRVGRLMRRSG